MSIVLFFKKQDVAEAGSIAGFRQKKHLSWWTPSNKLFSITGYHRNSNLLRYAPEKQSSPRGGTGKWLQKN
jgi:hypothetical protein